MKPCEIHGPGSVQWRSESAEIESAWLTSSLKPIDASTPWRRCAEYSRWRPAVATISSTPDFRSCSRGCQASRLIRASLVACHGIYGAPRVLLDLREAGETCSKHRVERLLRENSLRALHSYRTRRVSVSKPAVLIPIVLKRQFVVSRQNRVWGTDITYIRTWQGWLYLAVVMDLYSRHDSSRTRYQRCLNGGASTPTEASDDPF